MAILVRSIEDYIKYRFGENDDQKGNPRPQVVILRDIDKETKMALFSILGILVFIAIMTIMVAMGGKR